MLFSIPLFFSLLAASNAQIETSRIEIGELNPFVVDLEAFACKRLFSRDGTAQTPIGCGTDALSSADFGRLLPVSSLEDLNRVGDIDRAIVIPESLLGDKDVFEAIAANGNIKLVLVEFTDDPVALFPGSNDDNFNPQGTGLVETFFSQPIALLSADDTELIRQRIDENAERGFDNSFWNHGGSLDFFNGPADVTTEFCLDEDQCLPVGGQSVWGVVGRDPTPGLKTVVIAVKLDSNGLFHDLTFASRDVAGPLSVLLGIADAIEPFLADIAQLEKQVIFAAFQGESFDAVGSKRFIFDIENSCQNGTEFFDEIENECLDETFLFFTEFNLLSISDIDTLIVLDNLVTFDEDNTNLFIHTTDASGEITTLLQTELEVLGSVVVQQPSLNNLPGTVQKSFADIGGFSGEAIVITAYENDIAEANEFIFTRFDTVDSIEEHTQRITDLASSIGKALLRSASGLEDEIAFIDNVVADFDTIAELQGCLTQDFACDLVATSLNRSTDFITSRIQNFFATNLAPEQPSPPIFFPGVHVRNEISRNTLPSGPEVFTRNFLAEKLTLGALDILLDDENVEDLSCEVTNQCLELVTGDPGNLTLGDGVCNPLRLSSVACVRRKCVCSTVYFHDAVSPLINSQGNIREDIPEILRNERVITEPFFELQTLTLFQHSQGVTEGVFFGFGVLFTLLSYWFIKRVLRKTSDTKLKLL